MSAGHDRTDYIFHKDGRFNSNQLIVDTTSLNRNNSVGTWNFNSHNCVVLVEFDKSFYPLPLNCDSAHRKILIEQTDMKEVKVIFIVLSSISRDVLVLKNKVYIEGDYKGFYNAIYRRKTNY